MAEFIRLPTRSIGLKFLLVCALALVMAVPTAAVWAVLQDRLNRYDQVRNDISRYEGGMQTVVGPVLIVPYAKQVENVTADGKREIVTLSGQGVAFAETGTGTAALATEKRKRAIYTIPVFNAKVGLTAAFNPAAAKQALTQLDPAAQYDWSKARLAMSVSNSIGLLSDIVVDLGSADRRELKPATISAPQAGANYSPGSFNIVAAPVGDLMDRTELNVSTSIDLSGAERFAIAAFAKNTSVKMTSPWPDPSFEGFVLPLADKRQISNAGFSAEWAAGLVRRGLPEVSTDANILSDVNGKDFAVRFTEPTNVYTGVNRALKYSLMVIGLVFLAYFMFEIVSGGRAHPAQYILVGLAQAIFYLLLLAFAERVGFTPAFLIAAGATVGLISAYVNVVFKKRVYVVPAFLAFSVVYGLTYVLMQMEDYSLLVGSIACFAALAALMYLTRNVAWYGAADAREEGARP